MLLASIVLAQVLVAQPLVSTPRAVDAATVSMRAYLAGAAQVAPVPGGPLAMVWVDDRSGPTNVVFSEVTTTGQLLGGAGVTLSRAGAQQESPSLACTPTQCLVVWSDLRRSTSAPDLLAARVAVDGTVLDPTPLSLASGSSLSAVRGVATDGQDFLALWTEDYVVQRLRAARIDSAGNLLDAVGISIATDVGPSQVVFDGTQYLIAWSPTALNAVNVSRLTPGGTLLAPPATRITSFDGGERLLYGLSNDGVTSLVLWLQLPGAASTIYAARVATDGGLPDPGGFHALDGTEVQAVATDGGFLVFSLDSTDALFMTSILDDGTVGDAGTRFVDAGALSVSAFACQGTSCLALGNGTGFPVQADTSRGPPFTFPAPVARAASELGSSAACPSGFCLVSWEQQSPMASAAVVQRLALDGTFVDATPRLLSPTSFISGPLATSGSDFMATWSGSMTPAAERLALDGTAVAPGPFAFGGGVNDGVAAAFDGQRYVLISSEGAGNAGPTAYATQPDGGLRPGVALCPSCPVGSVAFMGTAAVSQGVVFVTWVNFSFTGVGPGDDLDYAPYAARFEPDGGAPDGTGIRLSSSPYVQNLPAIAASETGVLITWIEPADAGGDALRALRLDPNGTMLDVPPIAVDSFGSAKLTSAVAWDGTQWLVAWIDARDTGHSSVMGRALDANGAPLGPSAEWTSEANSVGDVMLSSDGEGQTLLAYSVFDPAAANWRLVRRIIGRLPVGDPCLDASACVSATCTAGVCCTNGCDAGSCAGGVCAMTVAPDAGTPAQSPGRYAVGCGCSMNGGAGALALLALALTSRGTRRPRRRP